MELIPARYIAVILIILFAVGWYNSTQNSRPGTCALGYREHEVRLLLVGKGAPRICNQWQQGDGAWYEVSPALVPPSPAAEQARSRICAMEAKGLHWAVYDTGGARYGGAVCDSLNAWAHGADLRRPFLLP